MLVPMLVHSKANLGEGTTGLESEGGSTLGRAPGHGSGPAPSRVPAVYLTHAIVAILALLGYLERMRAIVGINFAWRATISHRITPPVAG